MAGLLPASVYGLRVPASGVPIPGALKFPASFRLTMAAIDPSADAQLDEDNKVPRATLKLIREPFGEEDDDEDDDDEDFDPDDIDAIRARLGDALSDEDISDEDEDEDDSASEENGGPSDPAKTKMAQRAALASKLKEAIEAEEMDIDSLTNGVNGVKSKGKARALDDEDISIDSDDVEDEPEEFVICTLDPEKNWQQPLDITVGEHEAVYFQVSGTHDIYLTGNYVLPPDMVNGAEGDEDDYEGDELEYDLSPDDDELELEDESEDDELDGLKDPRVTEIDSDEEDAPKLVKAAEKKGKNKRQAESEDEDEATLDALISKSNKAEAPATNGEKLSKKQAKKLKKNDGQAAAAAQESAKEAPSSDKKTVKFAKNLELGPTGSPKVAETKKEETKKEEPKKEAAKSGPKVVQGVTIEDKKAGKGRAAKKGDKIEMRYIGKLKNGGKQFDANKKGKPFAFKLGVGEVIKGWDIGVTGITAGGERRLTIPAGLAYGKKALPDIPSNSDLVFDIKCISVS